MQIQIRLILQYHANYENDLRHYYLIVTNDHAMHVCVSYIIYLRAQIYNMHNCCISLEIVYLENFLKKHLVLLSYQHIFYCPLQACYMFRCLLAAA